jgi:hypothetical protein
MGQLDSNVQRPTVEACKHPSHHASAADIQATAAAACSPVTTA